MFTIKKPAFFYLPALLLLLFAACDLEDPREGISSEEVISLTSNSTTVLADGIATIVLTAELLDKSDPNQEVTFRTPYGSFINAEDASPRLLTVKASGREAEAVLQMGNEPFRNFLVIAEVAGFTDELSLTAERALPESMLFSTDRQVILPNAGNEARLTVKLFRKEGMVSDGTQVNFSQTSLDTSRAELTLPNFDFTTDNQVTVPVRSNNLGQGPVLVIARSAGASGEALADSLIITVRN